MLTCRLPSVLESPPIIWKKTSPLISYWREPTWHFINQRKPDGIRCLPGRQVIPTRGDGLFSAVAQWQTNCKGGAFARGGFHRHLSLVVFSDDKIGYT